MTYLDVCQQARIEEEGLSDAEARYIRGLLEVAKNYVMSYTGMSETELDEYDELSIALLALAADMYDNRTVNADNKGVNRVVDTILGMHSRNLL